MSEVWAVTEGEYSAYHVVCVCPTEEMANAIAEKLLVGSLPAAWDRRYHVEAFRYFAESPEVVYQLHLDVADVESGEPREYVTGYLSGDAPNHDCYHWVGISYSEPFVVSVNVNGMDHERVRKTFSEQWAQAKAEAPILIAAQRAKYPLSSAMGRALNATTSIDPGGRTSP